MKPVSLLSLLGTTAVVANAAAAAAPGKKNCASRPPAFFLAGDSTTAVQSEGGGGWGNGFLSFLRNGAWGTNYGHNGATTVSFVNGGDWGTVMGQLKENKDAYNVYVTIQFGHNDQKPKQHISIDEYQQNLEDLATEVRSNGGTPLLVTPLTRRNFDTPNHAIDSLHDERLRTIAAAEATDTTYLDLNQASIDYVDAIGEDASHVYNLHPDDNTHLNDYGSVVFGRMVADLLLREKEQLGAWFTPNETLSYDIWHGVPA